MASQAGQYCVTVTVTLVLNDPVTQLNCPNVFQRHFTGVTGFGLGKTDHKKPRYDILGKNPLNTRSAKERVQKWSDVIEVSVMTCMKVRKDKTASEEDMCATSKKYICGNGAAVVVLGAPAAAAVAEYVSPLKKDMFV